MSCPRCSDMEKALSVNQADSEALQSTHKLMLELASALRAPRQLKPDLSAQELSLDLRDQFQEAEHLKTIVIGLNNKLKVLNMYQQSLADVREKFKESVREKEALGELVKKWQSSQSSSFQEQEDLIRQANQERDNALAELKEQKRLFDDKCLELETAENSKKQQEVENQKLKEEAVGFKRMQEMIEDMQQQVKTAEKARKILRAKFEETLEDYKNDKAGLSKEMQEVTSKNEALAQELVNEKEKYQELENQRNVVQEALLAAQSNIEQLQADLKATQDQADSRDQMEELAEKHMQEVQKLNEKVQEVCTDFEGRLDTMQAEKDEMHVEVRKMYATTKDREREVEEVNQKIKSYEINNEELKDTLALARAEIGGQEDSKNIIDQLQKAQQQKETFIQNFYKEMDYIGDYLVTQSEQNLSYQRISDKLRNITNDKGTELVILKGMINEIQKFKSYQPVKDDPIDCCLAEFIAARGKPLEVPFIREEEGIYLFGSKRIFMKLEGDTLIIRIGGGFMHIDQFVDVYTPLEMERVDNKRKAADGGKSGLGKLVGSMATAMKKGGTGSQMAKVMKEKVNTSASKFSPMLALPKQSPKKKK